MTTQKPSPEKDARESTYRHRISRLQRTEFKQTRDGNVKERTERQYVLFCVFVLRRALPTARKIYLFVSVGLDVADEGSRALEIFTVRATLPSTPRTLWARRCPSTMTRSITAIRRDGESEPSQGVMWEAQRTKLHDFAFLERDVTDLQGWSLVRVRSRSF